MVGAHSKASFYEKDSSSNWNSQFLKIARNLSNKSICFESRFKSGRWIGWRKWNVNSMWRRETTRDVMSETLKGMYGVTQSYVAYLRQALLTRARAGIQSPCYTLYTYTFCSTTQYNSCFELCTKVKLEKTNQQRVSLNGDKSSEH